MRLNKVAFIGEAGLDVIREDEEYSSKGESQSQNNISSKNSQI